MNRALLMIPLLAVPLLLAGRAWSQAGPTRALDPYVTFARQHPGDLAVTTYTLRPDGTPDHALNWRADQPMPLASSMKIVVLAAYAHAVATGTLDPQQPVTLAQWERNYLPGTDGGAHADSLKALDIPADTDGRAQSPGRPVPLDTLARFMIETSDNAATDELLFRLGRTAVLNTIARLHLQGQDDIGPVAGMFRAWDTPQDQQTLLTMDAAQRTALYWQRAEQVRATPALRDPDTLRGAGQNTSPTADALQNRTAPMGTTSTTATLMAHVLDGTGLPAAELAVMRRHLDWPARINPQNRQVFTALYAKGGSLSGGVLTNTLAFTPKVGPAAGKQLVISVFLRNVPEAQFGPLQNSMDDAMLMIAIRPDLAQHLTDALGMPELKK